MEEGRLPLPNGIAHNGQTWKVGDWVHIQNPNDVTKPIVAQIYRTWQDNEGQKWVNACWYYRPEQTVHQYEKHFYPNEVVKTGQYRDHHIDEVVDRCFVMFTTRYSRGRPRGFPTDKEVYVCDSRYNEEKHKLNKIKTWASCLPDEVRDKDYEMDLFEGQKRVKKVPSPLLHMLKEGASENDELPKPRWGVDNAPPIVGAVYKGPRDENVRAPKIDCFTYANEDFSNHLLPNLLLRLLLNHHRPQLDKSPIPPTTKPLIIEGPAKWKARAIRPALHRQPPAKAFPKPTPKHMYSGIRSSPLLPRPLTSSIRMASLPRPIIHKQITVFLSHRHNQIITPRPRFDIHVLHLPQDLATSPAQACHLAHRKSTT